MEISRTPKNRVVRLTKLTLPYDKGEEPLTDKEIAALSRQGIMRSAHYLWLAERYMIDLSKLNAMPELDEHLAALSEVAAYMDRLVSSALRR